MALTSTQPSVGERGAWATTVLEKMAAGSASEEEISFITAFAAKAVALMPAGNGEKKTGQQASPSIEAPPAKKLVTQTMRDDNADANVK